MSVSPMAVLSVSECLASRREQSRWLVRKLDHFGCTKAPSFRSMYRGTCAGGEQQRPIPVPASEKAQGRRGRFV